MIQDRSRKVQNVPDLVEQFAQLLLPGEFSAHWQMFSETWRAVASHYSIGLIRVRLPHAINTLLVERTIEREWQWERLTTEDPRALTPLFHGHINPYGQFALDLARPSFLEAA